MYLFAMYIYAMSEKQERTWKEIHEKPMPILTNI